MFQVHLPLHDDGYGVFNSNATMLSCSLMVCHVTSDIYPMLDIQVVPFTKLLYTPVLLFTVHFIMKEY